MDHLAYMKLGDIAEDRTLSTGTGYIAYLTGNDIYVRFEDGSEEVVAAELFTYYNDLPAPIGFGATRRHWIF